MVWTSNSRITIQPSLPLPPLLFFTSNLLASTNIYSTTKTIDPDKLIALMAGEYEYHLSQELCWRANDSLKAEKDEVMMVFHGKAKCPEWKPKGTCWNCGGHYKNRCSKPEKCSWKKRNGSPATGSSSHAAVVRATLTCTVDLTQS